MLDEVASKQALAAFGLPIPPGQATSADHVASVATQLGFPLVLKAVSDTLAHKTEAGGVRLNLKSAQDVVDAAAAVAEFIVGVSRDPQFGLALTLGAGGVLVELLKDAVTLLLPVTRADIRTAFESLRTWPLVCGYRGRAAGDVDALVDAVAAVAAYAQANAAQLVELDVNPVLVLPQGRGVVAVDAMIRLQQQE